MATATEYTDKDIRLIETTIQWIDDEYRIEPQDVLLGVYPEGYDGECDEYLPCDDRVFFWLTPEEAETFDKTGTVEGVTGEWQVVPPAVSPKTLYTVTITTTQFVEAHTATGAVNLVYEALLNGDKSILGAGEVDLDSAVVKEGFHSTIEH